MTMKCAFHVHTNLSDGAMFPDEAIRIYADLGFGAIAITDHEFLLRDSYYQAIRRLEHYGMAVLIGVEADHVPWNYQHLLRIRGNSRTLHVLAHPASYYLQIGEINSYIKTAPFKVDAVETTQAGRYTPYYDDPAVSVPKIATDDAHLAGDCGKAWVEMEHTHDPDRIIRAIKAGDFQNRFFR
jgi:predicted metal-dependent phosphoesterase TrpH